ncbi:MAG: hypothetical protein JXL84_22255 [Deltaproteobacteria bacterium]|nr:hypothetical protein [Deltaproteobacteria bacterium]
MALELITLALRDTRAPTLREVFQIASKHLDKWTGERPEEARHFKSALESGLESFGQIAR